MGIEEGNSVGKMYPDNPVQKGDRCFPLQYYKLWPRLHQLSFSYLNAGKRPKSVINTNTEIPRTVSAIVRMTPIVIAPTTGLSGSNNHLKARSVRNKKHGLVLTLSLLVPLNFVPGLP